MVTSNQIWGYMDFYLKAPDWDAAKCPSTSSIATEKSTKLVSNQRVIKVINAIYRDAVLSGTFVLAPNVKLPLGKVGKKRVQVYCCWYGHKLPSKRGISLLVQLVSAQINENFSGEVVSNIAK